MFTNSIPSVIAGFPSQANTREVADPCTPSNSLSSRPEGFVINPPEEPGTKINSPSGLPGLELEINTCMAEQQLPVPVHVHPELFLCPPRPLDIYMSSPARLFFAPTPPLQRLSGP